MKWRNGKVSADQKFELVGDKLEQRRDAKLAKRAQNAVELKFIDPKGQEKSVPLVDDPLHLVHKELETILGPAIAANAAELNLVPSKQGTAVISILDTVAQRQEVLAPETASALIDYLKMLAALDTEDRRRIQEASLRMVTPSGSILVDLTVSGSSNGQRARICFDRAKRLAVKFDDLGLIAQAGGTCRRPRREEERHGVVLVPHLPDRALDHLLRHARPARRLHLRGQELRKENRSRSHGRRSEAVASHHATRSTSPPPSAPSSGVTPTSCSSTTSKTPAPRN